MNSIKTKFYQAQTSIFSMLPQKRNRENNQIALRVIESTTCDLLDSFKTSPLLLFTGTPKLDSILMLY